MMLDANGVSKSYGGFSALSDVSLHADRGEVLGVVGPNGAGKPTLVKVLSDQIRPDKGTVRVHGVDELASPHAARRQLALASQEIGVYPTRRALDNIVHFGRLLGLGGAQARRRAEEVAEAMRLTHLAHRRSGELSGGEQRRVHVAIALLSRA